MLITCKVFAYEMLSPQKFSQVISQLDLLVKSDAERATAELAELKRNIRRYSPSQQIAFYNLQSEFLLDYGEVNDAQNNAQWGLDIAQANNIINHHVVELTYTLGFAYESLGNLSEAETKYQKGLEAAHSLSDNALITKGLVNLGAIFYLTERFENSLFALTEALATAERENNHELIGLVTSEFGILYAYLDEDDKAKEFYRQCYESFLKVQDYPQSLNCLINLALNELNSLNYQQALVILKRAEKALPRVKNSAMAHSIYLNLAIALLKKETSDPEGAYRYLTIAEQYLADIEQYEARMSFYINKAYVLEGLERYSEALVVLDNVDAMVPQDDSLKARYARLNVHFIRTKIYAGMKNFQQALASQSEYAVILKDIEHDEKLASIQELRVKFDSARADIEREILQANQQIQDQLLVDENRDKTAQFYGFFVIAFILLLFAWWLTRLISAQKRLIALARIDEPTGIYNRQYLGEIADDMFAGAKSGVQPLSMLYIAVEALDEIDQRWGYQSADAIIKDVAQAVAIGTSNKETYGRLSSNEFVCLTTEVTPEYLSSLLDNINQALANISAAKEHQNNNFEIALEIRLGYAIFTQSRDHKVSDLLRAAENAATINPHKLVIKHEGLVTSASPANFAFIGPNISGAQK